jgi:predicted kinase
VISQRAMNPLPLPSHVIEKIKTEYDRSLVIPTLKRDRCYLLCPVGLVGSGKTTVVKPLSEELSFVRVSADEVRKRLKESLYHYEQQDVVEIVIALLKKYLALGYSVAIDSDCANKKELIEEFQEKFNVEALWIHVKTPEEFILRKLRGFQHTWLFENADQAVKIYYERKPLHENLTMPFLYVFDTSRADLPTQLREARDIILSKISG